MTISNSKSVSEVLEAAAKLIEPEGAWTQRHFARDADGFAVPVHSGSASCFCVMGALIRAANDENATEHWPTIKTARHQLENVGAVKDGRLGHVANWNDAPGRTQAEVVAKLYEAAALAREQGL